MEPEAANGRIAGIELDGEDRDHLIEQKRAMITTAEGRLRNPYYGPVDAMFFVEVAVEIASQLGEDLDFAIPYIQKAIPPYERAAEEIARDYFKNRPPFFRNNVEVHLLRLSHWSEISRESVDEYLSKIRSYFH